MHNLCMNKFIQNLKEIKELVKRGALFVINHSGGKDSQMMTILILWLVPAKQVIAIHAALGEVEWPGTEEHARKYTKSIPFITVEAIWKTGAIKRFLDMVVRKLIFPSPGQRDCTSDLKRGPINKAILKHVDDNNLSGLIVNCIGVRAEESDNRECGLDVAVFEKDGKAVTLARSEKNSKAGREWYDWYPIFEMTTEEVFQGIKDAGQKPHWAYAAGMTRLSCSFCIMSKKSDLITAAKLRGDLYAKYVALERFMNRSMSMPSKLTKQDKSEGKTKEDKKTEAFLENVTGVKVNEKAVEKNISFFAKRHAELNSEMPYEPRDASGRKAFEERKAACSGCAKKCGKKAA